MAGDDDGDVDDFNSNGIIDFLGSNVEDDLGFNEGDVVFMRIKRFIEANTFARIKGPVLKDLKKMSFFLSECGVRILDEKRCTRFICMLNPYYKIESQTAIKCTRTGASNTTKHMQAKHGVLILPEILT